MMVSIAVYRIFVGKPEGKIPLGIPRVMITQWVV
jgi:hypothetical protein